MRAPAVLEVSHLSKLFARGRSRAAVAAVTDATFSVGCNEILGVIGPNGAGKTTLIDLLAGVLTPTGGTIRLGDGSLPDDPGFRRRIGYVPSGGRSLYPRLTAEENLLFFGALHECCRPERVDRVRAVLHVCGAAEASRTRVERLSDGYVARVALARALLHDPAILLLDEPARSIDPIGRPALLQTIRTFINRPGKAAVLVTHDVGDILDICDSVAVMRNGQLAGVQAVAAAPDGARLRISLEGQAR